MKRIVVVCVAGAEAPYLVGPSAQLARETGAAVTVLGVDDVESQRFESLPRGELSDQAGRAAERLVDQLAEEGIAAETVVRSGPAAATAIEVAGELEADLIVVGAPSRGRVLGRLLGSLAMDLVQSAGRQVLVVTEPG